jgi:hypothetical protein
VGIDFIVRREEFDPLETSFTDETFSIRSGALIMVAPLDSVMTGWRNTSPANPFTLVNVIVEF